MSNAREEKNPVVVETTGFSMAERTRPEVIRVL